MRMKFRSRLLTLVFALAVPAFAQSKIDPPVPVRTVPPDYPEDLRKEGAMGIVVVKCTVDVQGNVIDPEVEKSTNTGFDKAAVEAVKKWKFKPAKLDGNPVSRKVSIPIKFVSQS
jgi:protein TonB